MDGIHRSECGCVTSLFHFSRNKLQVHLYLCVFVEVASALDSPVGRELFIAECHLLIASAVCSRWMIHVRLNIFVLKLLLPWKHNFDFILFSYNEV